MGALESEIYLASFNELIRQGSTEPGYTPIIRTNNPAGHGTWEVGKKVERYVPTLEKSCNIVMTYICPTKENNPFCD